jgi:hypothetical protein
MDGFYYPSLQTGLMETTVMRIGLEESVVLSACCMHILRGKKCVLDRGCA